MPWADPARRRYARTAAPYATDLTDAELALIAPQLPAPSRLGRPRTVDLREVLNAILYLLRSGCPWDLLPKELPAKSTVFGYFQRLWEDGRKRDILVDTLGLLLVVVIHAANIQDRGGLALVCRRLRRRFSWLRLIFADGGYRGETATCAVAQERLRLQIVRRELGTCGFAVLPRRWVVERTFAWLGRNQRLAKDCEATLASAAAMLHLASIQLLARRLARP